MVKWSSDLVPSPPLLHLQLEHDLKLPISQMIEIENYCSKEEATIGKMLRQTGDKSPSKFIHNSPVKEKEEINQA